MSADTDPGKGSSDEVARITQEESTSDLAEKGVPPELAPFTPGANWLIEQGGVITGHVEDDGDIVIDTHEDR